MARTYASIKVTRMNDPEWQALTFAQQGCYDFLLAHPKLSVCGVLDVKLAVWKSKAAVDGHQLASLLDALEEHEFISWDRDTDEIAIRTFVRHDGVLKNRNLGKGMWSAWVAIESVDLRTFVVDNLPELAFEDKFDPPELALRIRCRNQSSEPGLPTVVRTSVPETHLNLEPASAEIEARFTPRHLRSAGDNRLSGATTA